MGFYIKVSNFKDMNPRFMGWVQIMEDSIEDIWEESETSNINGGRCTLGMFYYDIESIVEAESFYNLNYSNTSYDPSLKEWKGNGWLSPSGEIYPCDWMEHDDVAEFYFKKDVTTFEKTGWLRLHSDTSVYGNDRITLQQYNKLNQLNIPHYYTEEDVKYN